MEPVDWSRSVPATLSQWSSRFEYKKSLLSERLSSVDYQLSEGNGKEWVFGTSYRARGIKIAISNSWI
jgi:hypothetical protein